MLPSITPEESKNEFFKLIEEPESTANDESLIFGADSNVMWGNQQEILSLKDSINTMNDESINFGSGNKDSSKKPQFHNMNPKPCGSDQYPIQCVPPTEVFFPSTQQTASSSE